MGVLPLIPRGLLVNNAECDFRKDDEFEEHTFQWSQQDEGG